MQRLCEIDTMKHTFLFFLMSFISGVSFSNYDTPWAFYPSPSVDHKKIAPIADEQPQTWESSKYFDTAFLQNYALVRKTLIKEEGFQEVKFRTDDGIDLSGLVLVRKDAPFSLIFCAGFYPGAKEGMATMFHILRDTNCNFLFFDARGHGCSDGVFKSNLKEYGLHEYRDVLAAIKYMHEKDAKDIVIHSICAGSFHALNALAARETKDTPEACCVRGLIIDSGFGSLNKAKNLLYEYARTKLVPGLLISTVYRNDTKHEVQKRYLCNVLWWSIKCLLKTLEWYVGPSLKKNEITTNLHKKVSTITRPVFYIHALDDTLAPVQEAQELARKTHHVQTWWVENSNHTVNHLKHPQEYKKRIMNFLYTKALATKKTDTQ